ncbi:hypothetical protein QFZ94_004639 [Paraburkholderia sp. JPY465]|uniref:hypothetical protein n=1 Tax=Paraburkholderia sp. JPY465 TaxID=3042285 RepID=UPI003D1967ED
MRQNRPGALNTLSKPTHNITEHMFSANDTGSNIYPFMRMSKKVFTRVFTHRSGVYKEFEGKRLSSKTCQTMNIRSDITDKQSRYTSIPCERMFSFLGRHAALSLE